MPHGSMLKWVKIPAGSMRHGFQAHRSNLGCDRGECALRCYILRFVHIMAVGFARSNASTSWLCVPQRLFRMRQHSMSITYVGASMIGR